MTRYASPRWRKAMSEISLSTPLNGFAVSAFPPVELAAAGFHPRRHFDLGQCLALPSRRRAGSAMQFLDGVIFASLRASPARQGTRRRFLRSRRLCASCSHHVDLLHAFQGKVDIRLRRLLRLLDEAVQQDHVTRRPCKKSPARCRLLSSVLRTSHKPAPSGAQCGRFHLRGHPELGWTGCPRPQGVTVGFGDCAVCANFGTVLQASIAENLPPVARQGPGHLSPAGGAAHATEARAARTEGSGDGGRLGVRADCRRICLPGFLERSGSSQADARRLATVRTDRTRP